MNYEEAWAGYSKYKNEWDEAGIPWNQKGSPHGLLIKARWFLKQLPLNDIVSRTIRHFTPQIATNVYASNALFKRLKRK